MRIFYSSIFILCIPLLLLRLCWRGIKAPLYLKRWSERFALTDYVIPNKPIIWLHAVSVGEVEASRPLVQRLQQQYSSHQLLITTMTPTGSARVSSLFGETVLHYYLPYDIPFMVKRFLTKVQPVMGIIMETELWPNIIYHCHTRSIPLVLANARLSEKSALGYQRIQKVLREMLNSFQLIAAQTAQDRARFIDLGANNENIHSIGNLKFEITIPPSIVEQAETMRSMWGVRPVFIAASTHEGEDEIILNACRKIRARFPDLLLVLVPRHPERFDKVSALCQKSGYKTLRRSNNGMCRSDVQVMVIDTMGELPLFYAASDVAFVGGSLVPTGGHNILEPAALGLPTLIGPHYFNFLDISERFIAANATKKIESSEELSENVITLLQDKDKRTEMGNAALELIHQSQGASQRLLNLIRRHIDV